MSEYHYSWNTRKLVKIFMKSFVEGKWAYFPKLEWCQLGIPTHELKWFVLGRQMAMGDLVHLLQGRSGIIAGPEEARSPDFGLRSGPTTWAFTLIGSSAVLLLQMCVPYAAPQLNLPFIETFAFKFILFTYITVPAFALF